MLTAAAYGWRLDGRFLRRSRGDRLEGLDDRGQ
jgi:hypothetical protein